jgi:hypothetical protein
MSLSRVKTWTSEVLTATDLNAEFDNILNFLNGVPTFDGIKFPSTQVPSGDANTLDDYEEGSWTPSIGGTATYTTQLGSYIKIGKLVALTFDITINSRGTGSQVSITGGVPFAGASGLFNGTISFFSGALTNVVFLGCYLSGSTINLTTLTAAAGSVGDASTTIFQNGARVTGTIIYIATA